LFEAEAGVKRAISDSQGVRSWHQPPLRGVFLGHLHLHRHNNTTVTNPSQTIKSDLSLRFDLTNLRIIRFGLFDLFGLIDLIKYLVY
jgi:hypothetical protein